MKTHFEATTGEVGLALVHRTIHSKPWYEIYQDYYIRISIIIRQKIVDNIITKSAFMKYDVTAKS
jgi:hypothetical protein